MSNHPKNSSVLGIKRNLRVHLRPAGPHVDHEQHHAEHVPGGAQHGLRGAINAWDYSTRALSRVILENLV